MILNAVALEAILQIDELIFVALYPKKVQTAIYELEPVKIRYTRRSGQLESCLMLFLLATAVSVPFFLWVKPITDMMLTVTVEYCGGDQDFVVSLNQDLWLSDWSVYTILSIPCRCSAHIDFKPNRCS